MSKPKKKLKTPKITDRATQYAKDVVSGKIVAGPYVLGSCKRHLDDLKNGDKRGLYYDENEASEAIAFFEEVLCLNGGQFEGMPFILWPWESFIVGSLFGWKRVDTGFRRFRMAYIETAKGPLALDTPIATTSGWSTMGEIKPGDCVFDDQGKPTIVTAVSPVFYNRKCFKLRFSDGEEIVADAEHKWPTRSYREKGRIRLKTTEEISKSIIAWENAKQKTKNHHISLSPPLDIPDVDLPISPYTLGVWLADGDKDGARLTINSKDTEILDYITQDGIKFNYVKHKVDNSIRVYLTNGNRRKTVALRILSVKTDLLKNFSFCEIAKIAGCNIDSTAKFIQNSGFFEMLSPKTNNGFGTGTIASRWKILDEVAADIENIKDKFIPFVHKLQSIGVLGEKSIPINYLRSSINQRLSLLRGLLDSDGSVASGGKCEVTFCNHRLALDIRDLLYSLGFKCTIKESAAKINGVEVGRRWRIGFQGYSTFAPFRLTRKFNRLPTPPKKGQRCLSRAIVSCDLVESVPVKCITVDAESHLFLAGKSLIKLANSGKTPLSFGIGLKGLLADNEPRAEIYSCATFQVQAMVGFRDACAFVDQSPELDSRLKMSGAGEKRWNIYHPESASFFRVISSEKKGQSGPRPHMYIADELHEHRDGTVVSMLEKGFKFRRQPLGIETTNSGSDINSFCFERHEMCRKISLGFEENDDVFAYICALDEEDIQDKNGEESEQYLDNEKIWPKVNPSLEYGLPGYDYIRKEVKKARGMPSQMAIVKRLNFCQWVSADNPWLSGDLWFGCQRSDGFDDKSLRGRRCWGGLDLSSTQDLTALAFMFEPSVADPFWRLKVYFWIPGDDLDKKSEQDHVPYIVWRDKGYITALPGKAINKSSVVKLLSEISINFDLQGIAYDRARIKDIFEFAEKAGIELSLGKWDKVKRQWDFERGDGIKMMPFGQESRSMEPAISKFEALLINGEVLHDGNPALNWCAANAVTIADEDMNRKISKKKSTGRVDGIVAAVMACGVTESNSEGGRSRYEDPEAKVFAI